MTKIPGFFFEHAISANCKVIKNRFESTDRFSFYYLGVSKNNDILHKSTWFLFTEKVHDFACCTKKKMKTENS